MISKKLAVVVALGLFSGISYAQGEAAAPAAATETTTTTSSTTTKVDGHCEKLVDGAEKDVAAKDKTECKKLGGKWNKGAHDEHK